MDYHKLLDGFDAVTEESRKREEEQAIRRRAILTDHIKLIQDFPDLAGIADVEWHPAWYGATLSVNVSPKPNGAELVRSRIQEALGVIAKRDFNRYDGHVKYLFTLGKDVTVVVAGGRPAPNCTIEPVEETVTRYKVVCSDIELTDVLALDKVD